MKIRLSSGHSICRGVCFFIKTYMEKLSITSLAHQESLQWMGAVRMRVKSHYINWWAWVTWKICGRLINCLDSHSDGTHSLLDRLVSKLCNVSTNLFIWRNKRFYVLNGLIKFNPICHTFFNSIFKCAWLLYCNFNMYLSIPISLPSESFAPELSPSSETEELSVSSSSELLPSCSAKSTSISSWLLSFFSLECTGIPSFKKLRLPRNVQKCLLAWWYC